MSMKSYVSLQMPKHWSRKHVKRPSKVFGQEKLIEIPSRLKKG